jgi:WD40 repeat protein
VSSPDLLSDPLLSNASVVEGYKVLGGVVLFHKIGRGGMGAVYRGRHLRLGVDVAVKVMAPPVGLHPTEMESFVRRFIREAQTAAAIRHPNLIRVYDVDTDNGIYYLVMDYVDGESAGDRLRRKAVVSGGGLSEAEAVAICLGAADGLAAAHRKGIVHRDVKPENLLIDVEGHVVVGDLGLAKAFVKGDGELALTMGLTMGAQAMGTPHYMSPEQTRSPRDVDPRTDVWSLGVTLYRLLTGSMPWADQDFVELISMIRKNPPPDLRPRAAGVSGDVQDVVLRSLSKQPDDRYADASEIASALRATVAHLDESVNVLADDAAGREKDAAIAMTPPQREKLTQIGRLVAATRGRGASARDDGAGASEGDQETEWQAGRAQPEGTKPAAPMLEAPRPPTPGAALPVTGEELVKLSCSGRASCVGYSPDGRFLAAGCDDARIFVWDADGQKQQTVLSPSAGQIWAIAFSLDGESLAAACENRVGMIWRVDSWEKTATLDEGHRRSVTSIAFSPDRVHLATGGADRAAILWDVQFGLSLKTMLGHEMPVWAVAFSPDGRTLALGSEDSTVSLWDVASGEKRGLIDTGVDAVLAVAYSPDGSRLATGRGQRDGGDQGSIVIWDVQSLQTINTIWGHTAAVRSVAFSPDGERVASASADGTVVLWHCASGERVHEYRGHESWVRSVAFSADGSKLASASSDRTVRVWRVPAST